MKICVATLYDKGYSKIASITTPNMLEYSQKHGYDFVCSMQKFDARPTAWQKITFLKNLINLYDWVLWVDTDILFMDFSYSLEDFIDSDYIGVIGFSHQIETGVFFLKQSQEINELLIKTYQKEEYINDGAWEQAAMKEVLSQNPRLDKMIKKISMDPINLDPNLVNPPSIHPLARAPGMIKYWESKKPFIIHAGWGQEGNDRKYLILKQYLNKVKK